MEGVACTVFIRVSGTPQSPKPPARRVELDCMSSRADAAEGRILLISWRWEVVVKVRKRWMWSYNLSVDTVESRMLR